MKWSWDRWRVVYMCGKCKGKFDDEVLCRVHEEKCVGGLEALVLSRSFQSKRQAYEALNRLRRVVSKSMVRKLQVSYDRLDQKYRIMRVGKS